MYLKTLKYFVVKKNYMGISSNAGEKDNVQLRDPKNDFIFNFNFDDKMKNFWTVWISRKINQ